MAENRPLGTSQAPLEPNSSAKLLSASADQYRNKTVLISGATGYIGSALVQALNRVCCRLVLLVRRDPSPVSTGVGRTDRSVVIGDVSERGVWEQALPGVDYVFHLAAQEYRHGSDYNPTLDLKVNTLSVLHLLEVCRQRGLSPTIVFASSSTLTGIASNIPVTESAPDNPLTTFAISKLAAERYLEYYNREFGLKTVSLRLPNVYGPVPDPEVATRVVLNLIVRRAVIGGPLTLFNNQSCIRDYGFIDDVLSAFLMAGTSREAEYRQKFVIGSGEGWCIADAINLIADRTALQTGHRPTVQQKSDEPLEAVEWRNFIADTSCFSRATGWSHNTSLIEGIDHTVDFFLNELPGSSV